MSNQSSFDGWLEEQGFTDSAARVLNHASQRSGERGLFGVIPPLMVLWCVLRWERKLGLTVLAASGVDVRSLENDVDAELLALAQVSCGVGFDWQAVNNIAVEASREGKSLGKTYIGTEHLMLALCKCEDEVLRRVFRKHGVSYDSYKHTLLELSD